MNQLLRSTLLLVGSVCVTGLAPAHVSVTGPGVAGATFEASFNVGHGCSGADTYSVRVAIPAGVTSVRPIDGVFGKSFLERDASDNVIAITWTKDLADVLPADTNYYRLTARMKLPDAPFTTLYFPATQVCRDGLGNTSTVEWIGTGEAVALPDGAPPPEPAPSLVLLPARVPGWNRWTVPVAFSTLSAFKDAEIVWAGDAAYSANPSYAALISSEPGTTALASIPANTEIWVKY